MRRAEPTRIPDGVAENQPALGIGVQHFDRLAFGARQDVARLDRLAARHVFGHRNHADAAHGRAKARDGTHRGKNGCAAGHVVLHLVHVLGRLDRDAAGVERDALANQPEYRLLRRRISARAAARPRAAVPALPRATPRSRPILSSAMRFSSSTSTARPASLAMPAARSAKTRGVRVLPARSPARAPDSCIRRERGRARAPRLNGVGVAADTQRHRVEPDDAADRRSCTRHLRNWQERRPRQAPGLHRARRHVRARVDATIAMRVSRADARPAPAVDAARRRRSIAEFFPRAEPDERHARGFPAVHGRDEQVERLALELTAPPRRADLTARRLIQVGLVGKVVVLEDGNDEKVGVDVAGGSCGRRRSTASDERSASMRVCAFSAALACPVGRTGLESYL